ncbi:MAG TPA: FkbM family methyltransferase [Lacipirellulaceae bacterium]|nr:FkbM family methyltransferase [Lacipirellulaceae bacterium]
MSKRLRYLYRAYRYRFRVDPGEIRFVRRSLRQGQVAVDIGCHKGAYTYWMRRCVGASGIVYAFEPQPRQAAYLREAFAAMRYDNVSLIPIAVSKTCGQMPLYMPATSTHFASLEPRGDEAVARAGAATTTIRKMAGGAAPTSPLPSTLCPQVSVDVTTLDDFFGDSKRNLPADGCADRGPNFIKIDVEGHELAVLEGAHRTLESHHPTILVECEARHRPNGDVRPVFDFLESLGYAGSFFCHGAQRPIAEFDPAVHQRIDSAHDPLPSGYVNNFAFER